MGDLIAGFAEPDAQDQFVDRVPFARVPNAARPRGGGGQRLGQSRIPCETVQRALVAVGKLRFDLSGRGDEFRHRLADRRNEAFRLARYPIRFLDPVRHHYLSARAFIARPA